MKRTLHLVRTGEPPVLDEADWVVYLHDQPQLADRGSPPLSPGSITYDDLVHLTFAADRVVTW